MVQLTVAPELTGLTVVERLLADLGQSLSRLVLDGVAGPNALTVSVASAEPVPPAGQGRLTEEPLTAAEIRVLRYLPTRLTTAEIGRQLYLSMHTVNSHMRRIYAKLDVHRRHEAVDRARACGLLADRATPSGRVSPPVTPVALLTAEGALGAAHSPVLAAGLVDANPRHHARLAALLDLRGVTRTAIAQPLTSPRRGGGAARDRSRALPKR
jgi:DNA-binding CsgD family transcriptional regulator